MLSYTQINTTCELRSFSSFSRLGIFRSSHECWAPSTPFLFNECFRLYIFYYVILFSAFVFVIDNEYFHGQFATSLWDEFAFYIVELLKERIQMFMILPSHTVIQHNTIYFFAIILVNTIPTALSRVKKYLDSQELRVLIHRQFLHCKHINLLTCQQVNMLTMYEDVQKMRLVCEYIRTSNDLFY